MRRKTAPLLASALAAALLSGCAVVQPDLAGPMADATSVTRSPAEAWASLPAEAGTVLSVVEELRSGVRSQRIVLGGTASLPGENAITVRLAPRGTAGRPTEEAIAAELAAALPGIPMRPADALGRNAYGLFAAATGAAGPFECVYAWQRIEDGGSAVFAGAGGTLDVRIRLCGEGPADRLVSLMERLSLSVGGGPSPMSDPLSPVGLDALAVATAGPRTAW